MPRAENRKRPPNLGGNVAGGSSRNAAFGSGSNVTGPNAGVSNKKQDLLEKMRKLQENKKTQE